MAKAVEAARDFSADYTTENFYALRGDGQWLRRSTKRHPLYGWQTSAWTEVSSTIVPETRLDMTSSAQRPAKWRLPN